MIFEKTIRRLALMLLEKIISTFPRVFSCLATIGLVCGITLVMIIDSEINTSGTGYAELAYFLFIGMAIGLCVVSIIIIGMTWSKTTKLEKLAFLALAIIIANSVIEAPAKQSPRYPKNWASLERSFFANYSDSRQDCPDITGTYFIQNDDVLNETFLGKKYNSDGWVPSARIAFLRKIPWRMMKISGDANESLTITLLRNEMIQEPDRYGNVSVGITKTLLHKRFGGYRCPRQWVLSDTSPTISEKNHVYFAKDKAGYLVAKIIDINTGDVIGWRHYAPGSEEHFNDLLSATKRKEFEINFLNKSEQDETKERAPKPNSSEALIFEAPYIKKPITSDEATLQKETALSTELKALLIPIMPNDTKLIGVKYERPNYVIKVLAEEKQQILTFVKELDRLKFLNIELSKVRENSNTTYAEVTVTK